MGLDFGIQESMQKVTEIIESEYPKLLSKIAEEIFASGGKSHGRNWEDNKKSTIKRKGGNSPNIETGQLENWLTSEGNLLEDDYMTKLPTPKRSQWGENNYTYANQLRKFDDIGRTQDDEEYIEQKLIEKLKQKL